MKWIDQHLAVTAFVIGVIAGAIAFLAPRFYWIAVPLSGLAVLLSGAAFIEHLRRDKEKDDGPTSR